jgi:mannosyl-3-phosphoglycerate phosphatase
VRLRAVFSDLDGTMLEPDGSVVPEVLDEIAALMLAGVAVCPVTSKTVAELRVLREKLGLTAPAGFENGAGVLLADGSIWLHPNAVTVTELRVVAEALRRATDIGLCSIDELTDDELTELTGLTGLALATARDRRATLPLVVPREKDPSLREALPARPRVRLIRGNRFLHLQGLHDKASVVPHLERLLPPGGGRTVACGDSPNDVGLLAAADIAVIVPSRVGPDPDLLRAHPAALIAAGPHGAGWAAALRELCAR